MGGEQEREERESRSLVSDSLRPHGLYWTIQSMEFSRLEYWSGLPFPSPGDLRDPQKELEGTSLVVQRLRLHACNAGGTGSIPGREAKIPHATRCGQK